MPTEPADRNRSPRGSDTWAGFILGPYQLMPPFSDDEIAGLREHIAALGILHPVTVDEHGHVLDGHHRVQVARELGIDPKDVPVTRLPNLSEEQKVETVFGLNMARRHLTPAEKKRVVAKLHSRGLSLRWIAEQIGVPRSTVYDWKQKMGLSAADPEYVTGQDGKRYRAKIEATPEAVDLEALVADLLATADRIARDGKKWRAELSAALRWLFGQSMVNGAQRSGRTVAEHLAAILPLEREPSGPWVGQSPPWGWVFTDDEDETWRTDPTVLMRIADEYLDTADRPPREVARYVALGRKRWSATIYSERQELMELSASFHEFADLLGPD